jgi:CO/xanthine dehydrogenase FAD-binding subunit
MALRGQKLNAEIVEEAAARVTDGVDVAEDLHASKKFRSHLARLYTGRAIQAAMTSAAIGGT